MGCFMRIKGIEGCCQDCQDRYPACHDSCEKYSEAKKTYEDHKELIKKAKQDDRDFRSFKINKIRKECKKRQWNQ